MKDVSTGKLGTGFCSEFTRVADSAELISVDSTLVMVGGTSRFQARKAFLFTVDTITSVTTLQGLKANFNAWLLLDFLLNRSSVNYHYWGFVKFLCEMIKVEFRNLNQNLVVRVAAQQGRLPQVNSV